MEFETLEIEYTPPRVHRIYVTALMREAQKRTFSAHQGGALVAFTGEAGVGKTTTAQEICKALERKFDSANPIAHRGLHFEFGRLQTGQGHEAKRAIKSVFSATGLGLDEGMYTSKAPEELAAMLVEHLRMQRIQMIFADEAGMISLEAIGGLVTLLDVAKNMGWRLTLIVIGMDDLALKLKRRPQLNRRVGEWFHFMRYELNDTINMLRVMHPHFAGLDERTPDGREQFEYVHRITMGLPGYMFPFINRFDYRWQGRKNKQSINVSFLEAVHKVTQDSMEAAVKLAKGRSKS